MGGVTRLLTPLPENLLFGGSYEEGETCHAILQSVVSRERWRGKGGFISGREHHGKRQRKKITISAKYACG